MNTEQGTSNSRIGRSRPCRQEDSAQARSAQARQRQTRQREACGSQAPEETQRQGHDACRASARPDAAYLGRATKPVRQAELRQHKAIAELIKGTSDPSQRLSNILNTMGKAETILSQGKGRGTVYALPQVATKAAKTARRSPSSYPRVSERQALVPLVPAVMAISMPSRSRWSRRRATCACKSAKCCWKSGWSRSNVEQSFGKFLHSNARLYLTPPLHLMGCGLKKVP
jgi:hypothetical protein